MNRRGLSHVDNAERNKNVILNVIRDRHFLSRREVAQASSLSLSTTKRLIEERWRKGFWSRSSRSGPAGYAAPRPATCGCAGTTAAPWVSTSSPNGSRSARRGFGGGAQGREPPASRPGQRGHDPAAGRDRRLLPPGLWRRWRPAGSWGWAWPSRGWSTPATASSTTASRSGLGECEPQGSPAGRAERRSPGGRPGAQHGVGGER